MTEARTSKKKRRASGPPDRPALYYKLTQYGYGSVSNRQINGRPGRQHPRLRRTSHSWTPSDGALAACEGLPHAREQHGAVLRSGTKSLVLYVVGQSKYYGARAHKNATGANQQESLTAARTVALNGDEMGLHQHCIIRLAGFLPALCVA